MNGMSDDGALQPWITERICEALDQANLARLTASDLEDAHSSARPFGSQKISRRSPSASRLGCPRSVRSPEQRTELHIAAVVLHDAVCPP
jgi:hypothetical protein